LRLVRNDTGVIACVDMGELSPKRNHRLTVLYAIGSRLGR